MIFADMNGVLSKPKCLSRKQFLSIKFDTSPPATRMCVFRILRAQHPSTTCPEDYHETCNVFPLREAKYTIAPLVDPQRWETAPCEVHPQQFWPESWSGSYWRWLMYQILGGFFGREIPENIKGHRYRLVKTIISWPDDSTQICKSFMQLHAGGS